MTVFMGEGELNEERNPWFEEFSFRDAMAVS
jgi:hypothetical protein